jgi:hypothetical protein
VKVIVKVNCESEREREFVKVIVKVNCESESEKVKGENKKVDTILIVEERTGPMRCDAMP